METFELNYSLEELKKRTDKEYLSTKKMLDVDAPEYLNLAEGDKKALKNRESLCFLTSILQVRFLRRGAKPVYLCRRICQPPRRKKAFRVWYERGLCVLPR